MEPENDAEAETEKVAEDVTRKLFEDSYELRGVVVELEEKRGDLDSLTLDLEDVDGRGDLEPLGLADSVAKAVRVETEDADTMGDVP